MAKKTTSVKIALHFLQNHQLACRNGQFHLYNKVYYEPLTVPSLRSLLCFYIQTHFKVECSTAAMVTEVVATLKDRCYEQGGHQPFWKSTPDTVASVLVLQNGILDLSPLYSGRLEILVPHTDKLFASAACDYAYDSQATCDEFVGFIQWMAGGDTGVMRLLLEFMAYCLLRDLDHQRFLILIGEGSNGKSVFLRVLQRLLGFANCSALSFERIGGKFDMANLADKAVNIAADTNEVSKVAEGNLKMLADGSVLTFEKKYQDSYSSVNRARLIFAANLSPRWRDRSGGLWRRMLMVPCDAMISGEKIIRKLENSFDYSGVLNAVLVAGRELISRGDFAVPHVVANITDQHRIEANPAKSFLVEYTICDSGEFVVSENLYSYYRAWCEDNGYKPLAANNFGKEVSGYYRRDLQKGTVTRGKTKTSPRKNGYENVAYCRDGIEEHFEDKKRQQKREQKEAEEKQEREQAEKKRKREWEEKAEERERERAAKGQSDYQDMLLDEDQEMMDLIGELTDEIDDEPTQHSPVERSLTVTPRDGSN